MKLLAPLLAALIPKLIEIFMQMQKEKAKETKMMAEINKEKARLKGAIDKAYDGKPVTKEQRKEVIDAARTLITNY